MVPEFGEQVLHRTGVSSTFGPNFKVSLSDPRELVEFALTSKSGRREWQSSPGCQIQEQDSRSST
jgi:hypothetical protein